MPRPYITITTLLLTGDLRSSHSFHNLARLRVALLFFLREDLRAVHRHLKSSFHNFHQRNRVQVFTELADYLLRQPGGACSVASLLAIKNLYFHHFVLLSDSLYSTYSQHITCQPLLTAWL